MLQKYIEQVVGLLVKTLVMSLLLSVATSHAQNKVVVVPLFGDDIPAPVPDPKIVFVSAEQPSADLGGLDVADRICQTLALAAGAPSSLEGKDFKAWLFGPNTDTFHFDDPTGSRQFVIPEGDLVSPSGRILPALITHSLTSGTGYQALVQSCAFTSSVQACLAQFDEVFRLETVTTESLFSSQSPSTFTEFLLIPRDFSRASSSCFNYTSGTNGDQGVETFSVQIVPVIGGLGQASGARFNSCILPTRFLCAEQ